MSHDSSHTNRLAGESSPYLRLHRHNPVDWYPWGEEALARARAEDRPIFLSVGYSTCYWCHVMERESFSDPATAALMNERFINIKVDREERPELDEIYMTATQILTQHGGWPNSVFLTPELKPFFAGTYFPPRDRSGLPGFPTVLRSLSEAWSERRADVEEQAAGVAGAMQRVLEGRHETTTGGVAGELGDGLVERALTGLEQRFDPTWGGFGGAPKFPTPSNLLLLEDLAGERRSAAEMLDATLDQMARGGIYDQLAGGFHRYATDREWKVPHFEKMLHDNGLLLELYARRWAATGQPELARIAHETAAFLEAEMTSPEGAFWSAIDAETDGHEGAYYVWTADELRDVLGDEGFGFLAPLYGFDVSPFFEGRHYVLHLPGPLAALAARRRLEPADLLEQIAPLRAKLLAARGARRRPLTDDKVLADWNGMAIAGLAVAGELLPEPALVARAARAASFVLAEMRPAGGPLHHTWRDGQRAVPAFLGDYAFLTRGLLALHRATGDAAWLGAACDLTAEQSERLAAPGGGFFVAAESPDVIFRSREIFDGAVPGANGAAALNLVALAEATGEARWREQAERALAAFAGMASAAPDGVKTLLLAARRYGRLSPPAATAASAGGAPSAGDERRAGGRVRAELTSSSPGEGGWRPFRLRLEIAPGWHLYAHRAVGELVLPTAVDGVGLELRGVRYPPGERRRLGSLSETVELYAGRVEIDGELRAAEAATSDGDASSSPALRVRFQACSDVLCGPPDEVRLGLGSPA